MGTKEQQVEQLARARRITVVQPGQPLALLVDALRARQWQEAAKQLDALTRSMSLRMTQEEREALATAVVGEMETGVLLDDGPPERQAPATLPTDDDSV